jgi:hypothetical protein
MVMAFIAEFFSQYPAFCFAILEPAPETIETVAEARFVYHLEGSAVQISCAVRSLRGSLPEVWLLNELGADFFNVSLQEDITRPPPPGWEALNGQFPTQALYDPSRDLWFRVGGVRTGPGVTSCINSTGAGEKRILTGSVWPSTRSGRRIGGGLYVQYRVRRGRVSRHGPYMKPNVSLIYPHFRSPEQLDKLFPPLGVAYLASQLKEAGITVRICDCTFKTHEEAVRSVTEFTPLIVGFSVMITMRRDSLTLLESLRKRLPGSLFIAGGPLPSLYPDRFARSFDLVFCGEADLTFARFCYDYISSGTTPETLNALDLPSYPGLYGENEGGKSIMAAPLHNPEQIFKNLPLPDRNGFDHPLYQRYSLGATGRKTTSIMITRGCPYSCDFCSKPIWGKNFRKPPLERVFEEIDEIIALGYDQLWIADDCFTLDLAYLSAFCME